MPEEDLPASDWALGSNDDATLRFLDGNAAMIFVPSALDWEQEERTGVAPGTSTCIDADLHGVPGEGCGASR